MGARGNAISILGSLAVLGCSEGGSFTVGQWMPSAPPATPQGGGGPSPDAPEIPVVSSRTFEWQRCGAIPPAEPCQRVQYTADGMLAVQRGGVIEIIDDSGPPRPLAIASHGFAFSPDGTRLALALGLGGSVELR